MDPLPDFGYDDYEGSGKLKGKVTAVATLVRGILASQHLPRSVRAAFPGARDGKRLRYYLLRSVMRSSARRAQRDVFWRTCLSQVMT